MKVKKTKLPENLYHYTSLIKYRMISATGKLVLTPSNLKYDGATFHQEPLYFNGHEIGIKAVDKYENYHPVVWLTANDHAGAKTPVCPTTKSCAALPSRPMVKSGDICLGALSATSITLTAALPQPSNKPLMTT